MDRRGGCRVACTVAPRYSLGVQATRQPPGKNTGACENKRGQCLRLRHCPQHGRRVCSCSSGRDESEGGGAVLSQPSEYRGATCGNTAPPPPANTISPQHTTSAPRFAPPCPPADNRRLTAVHSRRAPTSRKR